jgi:23S rRNA (adenine2503-C2)-methyltransferase
MDFLRLEEILKEEPGFRLKQAKEMILGKLISDWNEATNFPLALREKLNKEFSLKIKAEIFVSQKKDSEKSLIYLDDNLKIETVLMRHKDRNTICVSSQVGCPLGCAFCATAKINFKRNLTDWEIISQVLFFARRLKKENKKIDNIVFMGMGEPFLNYDNVLSAIRILNDKNGFNLGARHFSISTAGIIEGIEKLSDEKLQINLAVSLNAPNDSLRRKIMPIAEKYSINNIFKAIDSYVKKTKRRVMFEYVMIKDLNDFPEYAEELAKLLKGRLCFVNLIACNAGGGLVPSGQETIKKFKEFLENQGIEVTQRYKFGKDIMAACGQLAGRVV